MSKYIIESLHMHNFKVFDDFELDFQASKLVTFGGQNGYGKTTIFDAVELALTGNIARLTKIDTSSGNTDNLVAKNSNETVWIKIILSNVDDTIEIIRKLKRVSSLKRDNKISNFQNLWELKRIIAGNEETITQENFEELIDENKLSEYYKNFFYIQQEETAHFLKQDEKKRLETISELFNLQKEENELVSLEKLKGKISGIKETTLNKRNILSGELELGQEPTGEVEYFTMLHWFDSPITWDKRELIFPNAESKTQYLLEVNKIKKLIIYKDEIRKLYMKIFFSRRDGVISAFLLGNNFWLNYDEILEAYEEKSNIEEWQLKLDNIESILDQDFSFDLIKEKIFFDYDTIASQREELITLNTSVSMNDDILKQLLVVRNDLIEKFKESNLNQNDCPLCGYTWTVAEELFDAIERKKQFIESLLKSDSQRFQKKLDEFKVEKNKLKVLISSYLDNIRFHIHETHINYLKRLKESEQLSNELNEFCLENSIDTQDLLYNRLDMEITQDELISRINIIKDKLDNLSFSHEFIRENEEYGLINIYGEYKDYGEALFAISFEDISKKVRYIDQEYFKYNKGKEEVINNLSTQITKMETLLFKIGGLIRIYKEKIALHRKKIIKDIEIPFYIYSGKILQSVRENNTAGIFIKDSVRGADERINNIRFVSSWKSDHDVINTTSSGQLAGIVIALTLTLNMVYAQSFNTILIDDPIQSMDDINMISLVELLRNDFKDKQIFISTHEESIEKYILYKFIKHNQSVCRVNVMRREIYHKDGI